MDLTGKIIVVTGAARGIGAALAAEAASRGAAGLLLTDLDPVDADLPVATATIEADLSDPSAPATIVRAARDWFGRIDGLVNAAGITTRNSVAEADAAIFDRVMAVNARAPFLLMSAVIADMTGRGAPGAIVNIQSMNAHCGAPDLAAYAASKGALQTLTKNAANAHVTDRIRVNGINLGWVATETERRLHEETLGRGEGWLDEQAAIQPLGRFVTAEEAARLASFLLSDASVPMTGVSVDLEQWVAGAPP
ncbi:SDR family oxidoreductase [Rhodobacterales bacterium HKCCE3408]|nr:SDR family oxidoreductase [Rhodobacterales bacterium HKCCE3408]